MRDKLIDLSSQPWVWFTIIGGMIAFHLFAGPAFEMPVLVLVPLALATWHRGLGWGLSLALALPVVRLIVHLVNGWSSLGSALLSCANRALVVTLIVILIDRVARQTRELKRRVKSLEGILPICCVCKKIRDEKSHWHRLEKYVEARSNAEFSHGFCPECLRTQYGHELTDSP